MPSPKKLNNVRCARDHVHRCEEQSLTIIVANKVLGVVDESDVLCPSEFGCDHAS